MNLHINNIFLINSDYEIRNLELNKGVNIITGNSKTGKSALIEIVDYCLCSKVSTIPKGKISEFGSIYGIVLSFENKSLIIGRPRYSDGGSRKMYFKYSKEPKPIIDAFVFDDVSLSNIKDVQIEIERHLGLSVETMPSSFSQNDEGNVRKAGLREMTSFLFQHQNLIASKHALFYRFDDNFKRQATIDSFPVFAGWVEDEYFSLVRRLEELRREYRRLQLLAVKQKTIIQELATDIKVYFRKYYLLIGEYFDSTEPITSLLARLEELPEYISSVPDATKLYDRYNRLILESEELAANLVQNQQTIKELELSKMKTDEYSLNLQRLQSKAAQVEENYNKDTCPVCGSEVDEINEELDKIKLAKNKLNEELGSLFQYNASFQKEKEKLISDNLKMKSNINRLNSEINEINKISESIEKERNFSDRVKFAKAELLVRAKYYREESQSSYDEELKSIAGKVAEIIELLEGYDLDNKYKLAQKTFDISMSAIGARLDFEDELKPTNFHFDLKEFVFSHETKNPKQTIYLSEMGSGANWITCHLSIFLTFLKFFAREKDSKVPSILFLDQPSQVYFPSSDIKDRKDNDIQEVEKIFNIIIQVSDQIEDNLGYLPQIIITDHADGLELKDYEFDDLVLKRWTPEADGALI